MGLHLVDLTFDSLPAGRGLQAHTKPFDLNHVCFESIIEIISDH